MSMTLPGESKELKHDAAQQEGYSFPFFLFFKALTEQPASRTTPLFLSLHSSTFSMESLVRVLMGR